MTTEERLRQLGKAEEPRAALLQALAGGALAGGPLGQRRRASPRSCSFATLRCPHQLTPARTGRSPASYRRIKQMAAENGRDGEAIEFSVFLGVTETTEIRAETEKWEAAGASRMVLSIGDAEGRMAYVSYRFDMWAPAVTEGTLERLAERCFRGQ